MFKSSFLSKPFLNNAILLILLDKWNIAVNPKTDWKSKKKLAIGTKNTEEPKPPIVPAISAIIANNKKNKLTFWNMLYFFQI